MKELKDNKCQHEWVVFSTDVSHVWLMVQCVKCGASGTVDRPTKGEWRKAFHAPSRPYRWNDDSRITIRHPSSSDFYVVPRQPGQDCPCTWRMKGSEYERVPVEITRQCWKPDSSIPTPEERQELMKLADFVAGTDLCSTLFPTFVEGIQQDIGHKPSAAASEIAKRIEDIHNKGLHFRPAIVARVLRLYAMMGQSPDGCSRDTLA